MLAVDVIVHSSCPLSKKAGYGGSAVAKELLFAHLLSSPTDTWRAKENPKANQHVRVP
jgi:hypothetical protein